MNSAIKFIEHVTLNTDQKGYSILKPTINHFLGHLIEEIYSNCFANDGIRLPDGFSVKGSKRGGNDLITLYGPPNDSLLVTTIIVKSTDNELWNYIHDTSKVTILTKKDTPHTVPYIANRLEKGCMEDEQLRDIAYSFLHCISWFANYPDIFYSQIPKRAY